MAGFTTHYIFGSEMIKKLYGQPIYDLMIQYRKVYNLGLQGPDIFFYNLFTAGEKSRYKIGNIMHKHDTNQFFFHAFQYIASCNGEEKGLLTVYLAGLIAHHALDSMVHPYIYGRSGYTPDKGTTEDCFGIHSLIEINLDKKYLLSRKRTIPSVFKQYKTVSISKKERKCITAFLTECIMKTYFNTEFDRKNLKYYLNIQIGISILFHKFFLRVLYDPKGWKRKLVQFIEKRMVGHVTLSNLILTDQLIDIMDSMNSQHNEWKNPWMPEYISTESFHDLYQKAGMHYIKIMKQMLRQDNSSIDKILKLIDDKSYHTGLKSCRYQKI